jgi:hypothetical protein
MKRKAMLMGMAVMTGLPGWAVAKGADKAVVNPHPYSDAGWLQAMDNAIPGEIDSALPPSAEKAGDENGSAAKAAVLLAQIKSMLRRAHYGMVATPLADNLGWKMELLQSKAPVYTIAYDSGDPRVRGASPVGVAFRFKF